MIYYVIGIRRSGIHAIANWLFPMMGEYIYLNNYELGKLDEKELVVSGNFNVIIGIENKRVDEILKYCNGIRIWVYRDFEEVKRSQSTWYSKVLNEDEVKKKIELAQELDAQYRQLFRYKNERVIEYNRWNDNLTYRFNFAQRLHLTFNDSNKDKVFGYGISSYSK